MNKKQEYGIIGYFWTTKKVAICLKCMDIRQNKNFNDPIDELHCGLWACNDCKMRII